MHVLDGSRDCELLQEQTTLFPVSRVRSHVSTWFSAEIFSHSRWDTCLCGLWTLVLIVPCVTAALPSCCAKLPFPFSGQRLAGNPGAVSLHWGS